jgi:membrane fusion protein, multidrug efflux system
MSGYRIIWITIALLSLAQPAHAQSGAVETGGVDWIPVEQTMLTDKIRLDGRVEAVQESTVSAQTSGTIMELPFDVDERVEQDSLIARLEDTEQRSRLRQTESNLDDAQANLIDARQQHERIESLYQRNVASRSEFDEARNQLASAKALASRAKAAVAEAREQLAYTRVEAPYTGVVTARHVEIGEAVRPGQALLSGFSLDQMRIVAAIPQRYVGFARDKNRLTVSLGDRNVLAIDRITLFPFADADTHSFRVRLYLPEGIEGISPGMLTRVELATRERNSLTIPIDSLFQRGELRAVFVRDVQHRPRLRQVRVGVREDQRVEILSGLEANDYVAARPDKLLQRDAAQSGDVP